MLPAPPTARSAARAVPEPVAIDGRRRPRRRWIALVVVVVVLGFAVLGASLVPVPYVTLRPGSTRRSPSRCSSTGRRAIPPEESIAYTTVSIGPATLLEALAGWLDDDVDVLPEEAVRGGRSEEENRRYNAQLMDTSKLVAIAVALERLGHDVDIRTTGTVVRGIVEGSPAADGRSSSTT